MRIRGAWVCGLLWLGVLGCKDDPDPRPDAGMPDGGGPLEDAGVPDGGGPTGSTLSETPRWQVSGDGAQADECFGLATAVGDVNGDGRPDLLVGSPPCRSGPVIPGRVSFYAGEAKDFSKTPVTSTLSWVHPSPRTSGYRMALSTGNVDGDAYADVLVKGYFGVSVYKGGPDLSKVLAEPLFRAAILTSTSMRYYSASLSDLDGDGRDDLIATTFNGATTLYRSTPGAAGGPFTNVRVFSGFTTPVGDVDGDGAQDLMVSLADGSNDYGLFLGCKADSPRACDGPLTAQPVWRMEAESVRVLPDLNGDGRRELLVSLRGALRLHLSDAAGPGWSTTPVWRLMDDPAFPLLGQSTLDVGGMVEAGAGRDFVITALGRVYLFQAPPDVSGPLSPVWAWPRANHLDPRTSLGFTPPGVAQAGDLDGDGFKDLVVGLAPELDGANFPGRVVVYGGGAVPNVEAPAPALAPTKLCGLKVDPEHGKPDLTVDRDVLARTLYVERKSFTADSCEVKEGCVPAGGERRLLRFTTSIVNLGTAPLVVPSPEERPDLFVYDECHGHHHLTDFAGYALKDAQGRDTAVGRKQGFYMVDYTQYCADGVPFSWYDPGTGISPGWSDVYTADTACQWLDVTDTPDGDYTVRVGVDENHIVDEDDRLPNEATVKVRLKGDTVTVLP